MALDDDARRGHGGSGGRAGERRVTRTRPVESAATSQTRRCSAMKTAGNIIREMDLTEQVETARCKSRRRG